MIPFRSPSYIEQMKFKVMGTRVLLTLSLILGGRSVTWEWDKSISFILAIGTVTRDPQTIYCRKKGGSSKRFSYNLCNLLGLILCSKEIISLNWPKSNDSNVYFDAGLSLNIDVIIQVSSPCTEGVSKPRRGSTRSESEKSKPLHSPHLFFHHRECGKNGHHFLQASRRPIVSYSSHANTMLPTA